jgi:hypothetical protein
MDATNGQSTSILMGETMEDRKTRIEEAAAGIAANLGPDAAASEVVANVRYQIDERNLNDADGDAILAATGLGFGQHDWKTVLEQWRDEREDSGT